MTASSRILPAVPWVLALLLAVLPGAGWAAPAAPAPEKPAAKQPAKSGAKPQPEVLVGEEEGEEDEDGMPGKREERYERIIEMLLYHDPNDSSGHAAYSWAIRACEEGRYDEGMQQLRRERARRGARHLDPRPRRAAPGVVALLHAPRRVQEPREDLLLAIERLRLHAFARDSEAIIK